MAIYANDLSGLSAAAVADYDAQTRRSGLNQNFLAALAAERNRRALGEGQIGAENYRTGATREVGMGQVGVGQGNVAARNREIDNILAAAKMRDDLERQKLQEEGDRFRYGLDVQTGYNRDALDEQTRQFNATLENMQAGGMSNVMDPTAFLAVYGDYQTRLAQQQAAEELSRRLNSKRDEAVFADSSWFGNKFNGALGTDSVAGLNARISAGDPKARAYYNKFMNDAVNALPIEDASLVELDPTTATVKPRMFIQPDERAPMAPVSPRAMQFNPALLRRFPALSNLSLDPSRFQRAPYQ